MLIRCSVHSTLLSDFPQLDIGLQFTFDLLEAIDQVQSRTNTDGYDSASPFKIEKVKCSKRLILLLKVKFIPHKSIF